MNSVERVKEICREKKIPISKLERELGFANGYISQLKKRTFPADRLLLIAKYLNTDAEFLLTGQEKTPQPLSVDMGHKETAKNTSSQRTVDCPEYILDKLRGIPEPHKGQLFRVHPDTVRKHVHRACAAAGITDTTVHGLRHTNAAVMKTLGIDDRHAMERGGWSCESTYRKTYSYVFDSAAQQADTAINGFFSEKLPTKLPTEKNEH